MREETFVESLVETEIFFWFFVPGFIPKKNFWLQSFWIHAAGAIGLQHIAFLANLKPQ